MNQKYVPDASKMRAIGFCVSKAHAIFMAERFNRTGLASSAVTSDSSTDEREEALRRLQNGELQAVFTVDLYNEGVDIPSADVLLMLRPTESATVFMQQLGRGLRRADDKDVLTVLDFVGNHRAEFRFDQKLSRLTNRSRAELKRDIEHGFPFLPPGCEIRFDRASQEVVLRSLKNAVPTRVNQLASELQQLGVISQ